MNVQFLNEELLYFLWEDILPKISGLTTLDGKEISILRPGFRNPSTGPDYFNAMVESEGIKWAGNVEIHVFLSDWHRHNHQFDQGYDNIILHVVWKADGEKHKGQRVLEMSRFIDQKMLEKIQSFNYSLTSELPCRDMHKTLEPLWATSWIEGLSVSRLKERTGHLEKKFAYFNYNWQQLFYSMMMEAFGFHVNALPMFRLSEAVPVSTALKERSSLFRLAALYLGTSGMAYELPSTSDRKKLLQEYEYLKHKYQLVRLEEGIFKVHGMRPSNHPALRLMQFAAFFYRSADIFQTLQFPVEINEFFQFIKNAFAKDISPIPGIPFKPMGQGSVRLLVLNAWVLFFFFYGEKTSRPALKTLALDIMQSLPIENNYKTRKFNQLPLNRSGAMASQGIIHLFNEFCRKKKCWDCELGRMIMKKEFF
ncbi:MAG: DUF2851 family protein [Bacteroidia bacterium]|nr:DUF2851 family protein [Bacteroidia bacterium]